jgi:RimJ/RimL family protein N-acetyltransferase
MGPIIETARLRLRQWRNDDREPFALMSADPRVMQFFPSILSAAACHVVLERWREHIAQHGWGMWAAELRTGGEFIGVVGLQPIPERYPFSPDVEVGWRLARHYWGQGYAREAASAALEFGFEKLGLPRIVSVAPLINRRSLAVMERLGMQRHGSSFRHPSLPPGSSIEECCLYRITAAQWLSRSESL